MGQPFDAGPWLGRTFLRPLVEIALLRARWKYGLNMDEFRRKIPHRNRCPGIADSRAAEDNIPVRHSRMIHARNPNTQLWEVPGADHCGAISTAPEQFESKLLAWFRAGESKHDLSANQR